MNRAYGYESINTVTTPGVTSPTPSVKSETVDHLVAVCLTCRRHGDLEVINLGGILSYAHRECTNVA